MSQEPSLFYYLKFYILLKPQILRFDYKLCCRRNSPYGAIRGNPLFELSYRKNIFISIHPSFGYSCIVSNIFRNGSSKKHICNRGIAYIFQRVSVTGSFDYCLGIVIKLWILQHITVSAKKYRSGSVIYMLYICD